MSSFLMTTKYLLWCAAMSITKAWVACALAFTVAGCVQNPKEKEEKGKKAAPAEGAKPPGPPAAEQIPAPPDVAAPPADAEKDPKTGLAWKVLQKGTGDKHPSAEDMVTVNYTGWTTDGKMFDSSVTRHRPATFPLNGVIKGWTEGVQKMVVGEKTRFWIPVEMAYNNQPGRPAGMLVFDIELLDFKEAPKPIPAPADVAAPPKDAKKTKTGLAYKVLKKGTGKEHPKAESMVQVHYTGWTTDGKMFDSSVVRGAPATFPLNRVIPGWTEGVQLMVEGEKTRFWIPVELAYKGRPGAPQGMLVFDVELLKVLPPMGPPGMPPGHP
jgi:peptidylprolyl isomerase